MQVVVVPPVAVRALASTGAATNRGETGLDPQPPVDPAAGRQGRKGSQFQKPCRTSPAESDTENNALPGRPPGGPIQIVFVAYFRSVYVNKHLRRPGAALLLARSENMRPGMLHPNSLDLPEVFELT